MKEFREVRPKRSVYQRFCKGKKKKKTAYFDFVNKHRKNRTGLYMYLNV